MRTKLLLALCVFFGINSISFAQTCTGPFGFESQIQVDQFLIDNPTCTTIDGSVYINVYPGEPDAITNLDALQNITTINGTLYFTGEFTFGTMSTSNIDLSGLSNLTTVNGLQISADNRSQDFSVFSGLQSIDNLRIDASGVMNFDFLDQITTLESLVLDFEPLLPEVNESISYYDVFPNLTTINQYFNLGDGGVNYCDTLTGFAALTHIGSMNFPNAEALIMTHFDGLHNLQTIDYSLSSQGGGLYIESISGFESLQSMIELYWQVWCDGDWPDFESLNSVVYMSLYGSGNALPDFSSLNSVSGNIIVYASTNEVGFTQLQTVGESFGLSVYGDGTYNCTTINLNSLQSVGGLLGISGSAVGDLNFLSNLQSAGGIEVFDNLNLMVCDVEYFCENIPITPGSFTIYNNNIGCNSLGEVLETCGESSVSGVVYFDLDCDGEFNNNDSYIEFPGMYSDINGSVSMSNSQGYYFIPLDDNQTTTLYPTIVDLGYVTTTTQVVETTGVTENIANVDFPLCPVNANFHNLSTSVVYNPFRPGFVSSVTITVDNNSPNVENAVVTLNMISMPGVTVNTVFDGGVVNGNIISWSISNIAPFSSENVMLAFTVDAATPLGTLLDWRVESVLDPNTLEDIELENNLVNIVSIVIGSYDPNDIAVNIAAYDFEQYQVEETLWLDYLIRFQNTGTAEAINVRVVNPLDSELDVTSLEMISTSHDATLSINENNELEWLFENIMLPDNTSNEEASHGYIHYRIKTNAGLAIEDIIESTASIYFDFNEPVITNTATTVFYICPEQITATASTELCEDDDLIAVASEGWNTYSWLLDDNMIGMENTLVLADLAAGEYTIFFEGATPYCSSSNQITVSVASTPAAPTIIQNGNTLTASGSGVYTWMFNDQPLSETSNTLEITESGMYSVSVVTDGCGSELTNGTYTYTGVANLESQSASVFPNPSSGKFVLTLSPELLGKVIVVTDVMGNEIMKMANNSGSRVELSLDNLPVGIYTVRIEHWKSTLIKI